MKKISPILTFLFFFCASTLTIISAQTASNIETDSTKQNGNFSFLIGQSVINKSQWLQPYRFEDKSIKTLSVKININRTTDIIEPLDFDSFTLLDDSKSLRIRPSGVYYLKSDKKKYLKSKSVNNNYNSFNETIIEGYENFEAQSYNTNFLGLKKKNSKASIKSLKKVTIKTKKTSYFIDFPVHEGFIYGKIYYKNKPIGFAAVKN